MSYQIINICLVPDYSTTIANEFVEDAWRCSSELNNRVQSYYQLSMNKDSGIYSKPHCTLAHVKINGTDSRSWQTITTLLNGFLSQEVVLEISGLTYSIANIFSKHDIINNIVNDTQSLAYWFGVGKSLALTELQASVIHAINKEGECITTSGDHYAPHFTLWANTVDKEVPVVADEAVLRQRLNYNKQSFFLPCRIAIGNCGANGQVQSWITDASRVHELNLT